MTTIIIKTGCEIRYEMNQSYNNLTEEEYQKKYNEKWVSLIDLQNNLEEERKRKKNEKGWNVHYNSALNWVSSLLSEAGRR